MKSVITKLIVFTALVFCAQGSLAASADTSNLINNAVSASFDEQLEQHENSIRDSLDRLDQARLRANSSVDDGGDAIVHVVRKRRQIQKWRMPARVR